MKENRFKFGLWISVLWISILLIVGILKFQFLLEMKPNEWGDFLAGIFAPLAFLWLVLGYMQQGEELRLSTKALNLQAEELNNSVQQQRELVEVSRLQLESEREALFFERNLREQEAKPIISIVGGGGMFRGDGFCSYNLTLTNTGNAATSFSVRVESENGTLRELISIPIFSRGERKSAVIETIQPLNSSNYLLYVSFNDIHGGKSEFRYSIQRENLENPHSGLMFSKLDV
jgi:hypothetical protein